MLPNEYPAVDGDNVATRKCDGQMCQCFCVFIRLLVDGHEDGSIHDEEIGMRGRETVSIVVIAGVG